MDSPAPSTPQPILTLRRIFNAPVERVFAAWTQADLLASWFGPAGFTVKSAEIDLKIGGKYLIVLQPPEGSAIKHSGQYLEVTPPEKLVFTWLLENQACGGSENQYAETLVSIHFKRVNHSTEILLTHERLPSKQAYEGHEFGWRSSFDCLEKFTLTLS